MSDIPHPNITRLVVKNYRSLKDIDVRLQPLTVLVGENGSGKSNLIDVLRFVRDALVSGFPQVVQMRGGISVLRCWFAEEGEPISIHLEFEGPESEWSGFYSLTFNGQGETCSINQESFSLERASSNNKIIFEVIDGELVKDESDGFSGYPAQNALYLSQLAQTSLPCKMGHDFLTSMNFYDLSPKELRQPQLPRPPFPLSETGENLASTLLELQRRGTDWMITEALDVIDEGLTGYNVERVNGHLVTKLHYTYANGSAKQSGMIKLATGHKQSISSDLKNEADGTIQLLALLAALYQHRLPSLLAVEKPEKEILSRQLGLCSDLLQEARIRYQTLVTSHSPDLLNDFPVESFLVLEKEEGVSKIGPIIEYQQEALDKKMFSLKELMDIDGLHREGSSLRAKV